MTDNLKNIELRYQELEARLAANETYADPELVSRLNREQKELEPLVTACAAPGATWPGRRSFCPTRR